MTQAKPRAAPRADFIACHQPNGFDVFVRASTITAMYTNAEGHAAIQTANFEWIVRESIEEVVAMIDAVSPSPTPAVGERKQDREPNPKRGSKQNEDHAWPPRDRSDADAAKSQD